MGRGDPQPPARCADVALHGHGHFFHPALPEQSLPYQAIIDGRGRAPPNVGRGSSSSRARQPNSIKDRKMLMGVGERHTAKPTCRPYLRDAARAKVRPASHGIFN